MALPTNPLQMYFRKASTILALGAALAAQATPTPLQSSGSLSAYAQWSQTEPVSGQSNAFTPADPLAGFDVSVAAFSTDLMDQSIEVRSSASLSARWQDAARGTVDMTMHWSSNGITNGYAAISNRLAFEGWLYRVQTDVDSVFTADFTQVIEPDATTLAGVELGFQVFVDQAYVGQTLLDSSGRFELALAGGQAHEILLRDVAGVADRLGTNHTGLGAHFDWAISEVNVVPEAPTWALVFWAVPALALRRRYRALTP